MESLLLSPVSRVFRILFVSGLCGWCFQSAAMAALVWTMTTPMAREGGEAGRALAENAASGFRPVGRVSWTLSIAELPGRRVMGAANPRHLHSDVITVFDDGRPAGLGGETSWTRRLSGRSSIEMFLEDLDMHLDDPSKPADSVGLHEGDVPTSSSEPVDSPGEIDPLPESSIPSVQTLDLIPPGARMR